ncbi:MAG: thiamine pyrophosphate-binding protein [Chloroflexi bacterium]|nr:thiamine pyrophosphate-binding protein [Chloroflexota bacterium]
MSVPVADRAGSPEWGSDVVMDMLRRLGIEYSAILPGSTFRAIHDSAVNYTANRAPELILCNHEMITVALARGYFRATGRPMAALLHNVVGLLNASMTIYDAWCDRAPVLVIGGTGPLDSTRRRGAVDWQHTANVQGGLVREFTKWDDQPGSVADIPESLLRAYRIAVTEPAGPVYVCFDVTLQEQRLVPPHTLPEVSRYRRAPPAEPDRNQVKQVARLLVEAEMPVCLADRSGAHPAGVPRLVELAELLAMPVVSLGGRTSFPTPHAYDFYGEQSRLLPRADVVLALDVLDLDGALRVRSGATTRDRGAVAAAREQTVIHVSLDELVHRGGPADYQPLPAVDVPMLVRSDVALPFIVDECRSQIQSAARDRIERRRDWLAAQQAELRARHQQLVHARWDGPGISETRLMGEVWQAVKDFPFVFTYDHERLRHFAPGVATLSGPGVYFGYGGGAAVGAGPGVALGAALALRGSGKLPVAVLGDGEMLASVQALWTAAHHRIPGLWVVDNNRSYSNDEMHQRGVAVERGRPVENRGIAVRIEDPAPDFAALARGCGIDSIGPIKDALELSSALSRATERAARSETILVDVWTVPPEVAGAA